MVRPVLLRQDLNGTVLSQVARFRRRQPSCGIVSVTSSREAMAIVSRSKQPAFGFSSMRGSAVGGPFAVWTASSRSVALHRTAVRTPMRSSRARATFLVENRQGGVRVGSRLHPCAPLILFFNGPLTIASSRRTLNWLPCGYNIVLSHFVP